MPARDEWEAHRFASHGQPSGADCAPAGEGQISVCTGKPVSERTTHPVATVNAKAFLAANPANFPHLVRLGPLYDKPVSSKPLARRTLRVRVWAGVRRRGKGNLT